MQTLIVTLACVGVTQGALVARDGKRVVDVPLEHTKVSIHVSGSIAEVEVAQRFTNPWARAIEAIYAFPLPAGAAVDRLELRTGDELITGSLVRRAEAKAIYRKAKSLGKIAALLEEEGAGVFTQSVANIAPNAKIEVVLHYRQELARDDETWELVFPLVITPRPISSAPKAPRFLPPDARSSHDVELAVELDAGLPIEDISSPSHHIELSRSSASAARVELARDDTIPNKDFVLRYRAAADVPRAAVIAGGGAFLLLVEPPRAAAMALATPREVVFAFDSSSSMSGGPLAKARAADRRTLRGLGPEDTFQMIAFSDGTAALAERPVAVKPRNVELALGWLDSIEAGGGTQMIGGIAAALDAPRDPDRLRLVVLLTDGYVGDDAEVLRAVHEHLGSSRLFTFGIGSAVNRYLLEELAEFGRGTASILRSDEDESLAVERFHRRIAKPVMTDLTIDWRGLDVADVVPRRMPDLFEGQPLAIRGRYRGAGAATIEISGMIAGERITVPADVVLPAGGPGNKGVAALWAKARIRELTRDVVRSGDKELVEEITQLALQNGLLTPYTAFVAVSTRIGADGPAETVPVPVEAPEGLEIVQGFGSAYGSYGVGAGAGASSIGSFAHASGYGSSAGSLGLVKIEREISITMSAPIIMGALDKDLVRKSLANHRSAIKYCYDRALIRNPRLSGRVVVRFTVQPAGNVANASIAESTLGDAEAEACIAKRIATISFPASGEGLLDVTMPYVFRSPDEQKEAAE